MCPYEQLPPEFNFAADYGDCCVWLDNGGASLNCFDVSDQLKLRASNWVAAYFEDEPSPAGQTRDEYNQEGLQIAKSLKAEIGNFHKITYVYFESDTHNAIFKSIAL